MTLDHQEGENHPKEKKPEEKAPKEPGEIKPEEIKPEEERTTETSPDVVNTNRLDVLDWDKIADNIIKYLLIFLSTITLIILIHCWFVPSMASLIGLVISGLSLLMAIFALLISQSKIKNIIIELIKNKIILIKKNKTHNAGYES